MIHSTTTSPKKTISYRHWHAIQRLKAVVREKPTSSNQAILEMAVAYMALTCPEQYIRVFAILDAIAAHNDFNV